MRIGLLTTSFPRFEGDVAGSFVLGFARALAARGHRITVLAPEPSERQAPPVFGGAFGDAIETRYVPYIRPHAWARTFYGAGVLDNLVDPRAWPGLVTFPPALALATRHTLREHDALVSHFAVPCGLVAALLRDGRPHVAVLHSADLHVLEHAPGGSTLARALVAGASHVTCVSQRARAKLLALLPEMHRAELADRVHVQAMGLDAHAIARSLPARAAARATLGLRGFTLLSLARLVPIKGLAEALEALAARDDLEWIIAGDGPLRAELTRRAASSRARVRLVGEVRGADKLELLAAADALLLPSRPLASGRTEGAPLALLEAMAARLPVIASDTGGIGELVAFGRAGLLFDPTRPETLLAAVDRAQSQAGLSMRVDCAQAVARDHDWQHIAERYERWLQ